MGSLPRLTCCTPMGYDGASQTPVHTCMERREQPLDPDEWALWRSQIEHPARYTPHASNVVPLRTYSGKPRRAREYWNQGFRDPDWEDFV